MFKIRYLFLLALVCLTACATQPQMDPALLAEAKKPLICKNKSQCDLYWQRAQFWVSTNSAFKIQTATDTIIETYTPVDGDVNLGYRVSRERSSDGTSRIWLLAGCANIFGCAQTPEAAALLFKRYVQEK